MTLIDGDDAAPDGFRHVGTGVDGNHDQCGSPDACHALEGNGTVGKVGQTVEDEHSLQHHGGAPEYLHIDADNDAQQLQEEPLDGVVVLGIGDGVQDTADKSDHAAC